MNNYQILKSISNEKIHLSLFQSIEHYRVSILLFIVFAISFTNGLKTFTFSELESTNVIICIIFAFLSLISFLYQKSRLKLISIRTEQNDLTVFEKITELAKQKDWKIELVEKNAMVINTNRPFSSGKVFISKSGGEKIFVFLKLNKILYRSIFDLKKGNVFVISSGENNENEKRILEIIKASC
ncbi:hypothetical protein KIH23_10150 [Flavobacterium sp. CYK-55]|uniref:hypothetical protein n=1 Tax=Flavobacterium sp. CYK-55 TaxID=2835529 RepID=UPI001BCBF350|nr:hypothetical protein [Flavobacterium sp. CYK-55]MBS7787659.1 hypothetical protein [Flavobacterium sp. CYK-55]